MTDITTLRLDRLRLEHTAGNAFAMLTLKNPGHCMSDCAGRVLDREDLVRLSVAIGQILSAPGMVDSDRLDEIRDRVYG